MPYPERVSANSFAHNRLRQLRGLVTIDPWHEGRPNSGKVELHAYVNFDEARLGGESTDDVAFRLQLRRAEMKLLQSEPKSFEIDPARIWRGDQDSSGKLVRKIERALKDTSELNAHFGAGIAPSAKIGGSLKQQKDSSENTEFTSFQSSKHIAVSFQRNSRDQPTWILKPNADAPTVGEFSTLQGQPWDDKAQALLILSVDKRHEEREMLSSLRLCLICKREDLIFYDIKVRNSSGEFVAIDDKSPKRVIVQEYLKSALISEGLHAGDMDSPFAIISLGEAISEQRKILAEGDE